MSGKNRQQMVWRAFRVEPQTEFIAARMLAQRRYKVKVPVELRLRRKSRYCKSKRRSAYPFLIGYVFVRLPEAGSLDGVLDVDCVKSPVRFGLSPIVVPDMAMRIMQMLAKQNNPHRTSTNTRMSFVVGDTVEVAEGPFQGWSGKVEEIRGEKARLVFQMFGAARDIDIPCEQLQGC